METVFNLPAHVFFVHAPLVLVPLVAVGCIVLAVRPRWQERANPWLLGAAVVAFGTVLAATQSGEAFDRALRRNPNFDVSVRRHADLADTTQVITFVMVALLAVAVGSVWWSRRSERPVSPAVLRGLSAAAALVGVLATIWMVRTGHEGAHLVWQGVLK